MGSTKSYKDSTTDGELSKEEQEALLASALEQAKSESEVNFLPPPETFEYEGKPIVRSEMIATAPTDVNHMQIAASMNAATREHANAHPDKAVGLNLQHDDAQLSRALSASAPVQAGFSGQTFTIPASVRTAPNELHVRNPASAQQFWKYFLPDAEVRGKMAGLCAKKGFDTKPLLFLSPWVYTTLEVDGIVIRRRSGDPFFTEADADKSGNQYTGLVQCFGYDNARLLLRECERSDIGVRAAIHRIAEHIIGKHEAELDQVKRTQTVTEWT